MENKKIHEREESRHVKEKYLMVFQAQDTDSYEEAVEYINRVARQNSDHREKNRVNYYIEGDMRKKIRTTPSKRTIELTLTVDEEIVRTLKNILNLK